MYIRDDTLYQRSMDVEFSNDFFEPAPDRHEGWPDHPELRRAVEWLKTFMSERDWAERREAAARRLYEAALGKLEDPTGKGRFFAENDTFGWYLFLAEAFLDHIWNYEPVYGSSVVPVLAAIGRDLPLLRGIRGLDTRGRRLLETEKRQPNGALFELLVAGAYRRVGAEVVFIEERPGQGKAHDMNIRFGDQSWAVECKRMETGEYGERERTRMRELWGPSSDWLARHEKSAFCDAHFTVEIGAVPADYLTRKVKQWLASSLPCFRWNDESGHGEVGDLNLAPLRTILAANRVLVASSRMLELLTGRYVRNANYISFFKTKPAGNPRYIEDCARDPTSLGEHGPCLNRRQGTRYPEEAIRGNGPAARQHAGHRSCRLRSG